MSSVFMPKHSPSLSLQQETMSLREYVRLLDTVHKNALTDSHPVADVPDGTLKLPLHEHQRVMLAAMESYEKKITTGMTVGRERMFAKYGILGDSVGTGKSLMVLSHIARVCDTDAPINPIQNHSVISAHSSAALYSIRTDTYTDASEANCLIIVPHTLFRQWSEYIQKQTNLPNFCIKTVTMLESETFLQSLYAAKVVLISNTLCKQFVPKCQAAGVRWKRIFIDEADTIHIPQPYNDILRTSRFNWFVTASWIHMLYLYTSIFMARDQIASLILNPSSQYFYLADHFKSRLQANSGPSYYFYESFRVKSAGFFRDFIATSHPSRAHMVLTCSKALIEKSIQLPGLIQRTIHCRAPLTHTIVQGALTPQIQQMLHAGDTAAALEHLGVKGSDTKTLVEAVTASMKKELERHEKTYEFKASLEYNNQAAKEAALASLQAKIDRTKQSIADIEARVSSVGTDVCPICYDDTTETLVTPCCSRGFCTGCLLMSMTRNPVCPLCRTKIHPSQCVRLLKEDETNGIVDGAGAQPQLPKKQEALLRLLQETPDGRFLVFSKYDHPFESLEARLDSLGVKVQQLKGSKDTVAATLEHFRTGRTRCLLLNSQFAGAGLNITAATHVVLFHAMTHEEEKQILGRAYRIGRVGPLQFIKLLHDGEMSHDEASGAGSMSAAALEHV